MIAIIDYGAGNLHSVKNALDFLGAESVITGDKDVILSADKVILPGVGAFGDAMKMLEEKGLVDVVRQVKESKKPLLGICLGLHLMFEESEESPGVKGIGLFGGKVKKIPDCALKIPHIGWNNIETKDTSWLFSELGTEPYVYFVHSYYAVPEDESIISAYTEYGERLSIAIEKDNVAAVQFHPEKSSDIGMKILKNFILKEGDK